MWAVARAGVLGFTCDWVTGAVHLELGTGAEVIRIPVFADETFSFSEVHGTDENGEWWEPTVTGVIPKRTLGNSRLIERLERGEWLLISEDGNGELRVSGSLSSSMWFSTDGSTGSAFADRNGVTFTATCRQQHPTRLLASLPWDND